MKARLSYAMVLFTGCALVSCKSAMQEAKEIEYEYSSKAKDDTYVKIYYAKANHKKLNGFYSGTFKGYSVHKDVGLYKNGLATGLHRGYINDTLVKTSNYAKGLEEGKQLRFDEGDSIVSYYIKGIKHGIETHYINGKPVRTTTFSNGIKSGQEKYFNVNGEASASANYTLIVPDFISENGIEDIPAVQNYLKDKLKINEEFSDGATAVDINHPANISVLTMNYKYLGDIKMDAYITPKAYEEPRSYYSRPHFGYSGSIETILSGSLGKTLAGDKYDLYAGFFYTITLFIGELDAGEEEQWIIFVSKDFPERLLSIKIEK